MCGSGARTGTGRLLRTRRRITPGVSESDAPVVEGKDDKGKVLWKELARVVRGGCWYNNARRCRSANRGRNAPGNRNNNIGLRIALLSPSSALLGIR